ncbi:MAG TPA: UDP-3-O-(3-hydroxymyristoyl)glucosamine N-acyltransferase [Opitutaceae bacterium]|nr:UDP-3-O-(3-hydroxymyristoyl)glucosamine N-acyltransferase [Opitutaceae bacterium]
MKVSFTQADIAAIAAPVRTVGATKEVIRGIASLASAKAGDISFLGNPKYRPAVASTRASIVLLPPDYKGEPGPNQVHMLVDNPSAALARLCSRVEQTLWPRPAPGIHPTAVVAPDASVAASATVGPLCVVERGARIGEGAHLQSQVFVGRGSAVGRDCWLMPGVVICAECTLGDRVRLHPGVVVGSDGFGYEFVSGRHEKVPQVGTVVIGDDVEIGSNSTIDRSRFERTLIGEGTKIDNLVQVGHNVVIGRHCLICAHVGIAGSVTLQDYVVVGGQAGIAGHITIGTGAQIAAKSGVKDDIAPKSSVWGSPCLPLLLEQKIIILRGRLPELFKRVDALEKKAGLKKG